MQPDLFIFFLDAAFRVPWLNMHVYKVGGQSAKRKTGFFQDTEVTYNIHIKTFKPEAKFFSLSFEHCRIS